MKISGDLFFCCSVIERHIALIGILFAYFIVTGKENKRTDNSIKQNKCYKNDDPSSGLHISGKVKRGKGYTGKRDEMRGNLKIHTHLFDIENQVCTCNGN